MHFIFHILSTKIEHNISLLGVYIIEVDVTCSQKVGRIVINFAAMSSNVNKNIILIHLQKT